MALYTGTWDHDIFVGTSGNDIFRNIAGGDTVDGGGGWDIISIDLSYTNISVNYNAVTAATAAGTQPLWYMSVKNVEQLGVLKTGGGDDSLTISSAQGAFSWQAGAGSDTLIEDFSGALAAAKADFTVDGYTLHTDQWGVGINAYATDIERVVITGSRYADDLRGTNGDDILKGGDGDDYLDTGASGKDLIDGGAGSDTVNINYYLSATGIVYDAVKAAMPTGVTMANGTVIRNVEHFSLTGGDGNDSVNVSSAQGVFVFIGNGGLNTLTADYSASAAPINTTWLSSTPLGTDLKITSTAFGSGRADAYGLASVKLTGSSFDDQLQGTAGNDWIDGRAGKDSMSGGAGNDTYVVDNSGDVVIEAYGQGTDTVMTSVSFSLNGQFIENLNASGTSSIILIGNSLQNSIVGNSGNNVIDGGLGADRLTGGAGADTFVFQSNYGADVVTDFSCTQGDMINLHAVTNGVAHFAFITQVGTDVHIDLGGGNVVTVLNVTNDATFQSHILW